MRDNIYYWKCDSPHSLETKRRTFFKDKYDREGLEETVREACERAFGGAVQDVKPLRVDGNHLAFTVCHADQEYFFRADDGGGDDDYMLAESALMGLAADAGVPVPRVVHTDVDRIRCPFRFQIMECCPDPCLNAHHKAGTLNSHAVATQLGLYLRRLHTIRLDGFGFVDTRLLRRTGRIRGLDASYRDYFHKRFDDHLNYLRRHNLLSGDDCDEVRSLFRRNESRLDRTHGVLVHRDMALWNVLGTPDRITAIIDWDDAVGGDPADDLGILGCFYDDDFMNALTESYWDGAKPPEDFVCRVELHTLRNMLWKTMLRHALGYFEKDRDFFLNTPDVRLSLKDHTLNRLQRALTHVRSFENP
jgi:aminoglycoside phosphotransferase (APT) family kinase protein